MLVAANVPHSQMSDIIQMLLSTAVPIGSLHHFPHIPIFNGITFRLLSYQQFFHLFVSFSLGLKMFLTKKELHLNKCNVKEKSIAQQNKMENGDHIVIKETWMNMENKILGQKEIKHLWHQASF